MPEKYIDIRFILSNDETKLQGFEFHGTNSGYKMDVAMTELLLRSGLRLIEKYGEDFEIQLLMQEINRK